MTNNLSTTHPVKKQPSDNKNWEAHACTNPGNGMGETARKYREKRAARASELNGQEKTHSSEQISRHNCAERRLREHSSTSTREHMKSKMNGSKIAKRTHRFCINTDVNVLVICVEILVAKGGEMD